MTKLTPLTSASPPARKRLVTALEQLLYSNALFTENLLPAEIVQYDRESNLATVRPMIMFVDVSGNGIRRNQVVGIPVLSLGAGGFHISFPIKEGDLGWIYASDRDISQFKQSLSSTKPSTGRNHKFADGMFIPDMFRKYVINQEDADAMVIQSVDSATRISIRGDNIKITAPSNVTVDTPLATFTNDVAVGKNLTVTGDAVINGEAIVKGIAVSTHGHISSAPGNRTANGMIA